MSRADRDGDAPAGWRARIGRVIQGYDAVLSLPHRQEIARELQDEEDLFMLLCFCDMMGIPNPVSDMTLELYPYMLERFHEWHRRQGIPRSPLDSFRCC
ncbi:cory-CC-star protein [Modicisalibacter tunisiensis]|uniref:DNA helicase n=1 Tax=Modicisalibacter tunisiensis TaxID=390637 RepID=A0ABS7WXD6_9GAMM|nr:cory-CC-star protein [Modicisalibacter tunisiensis]MBZ9567289.1 hypothetical protein [Modicisalibacter tunisiensis]